MHLNDACLLQGQGSGVIQRAAGDDIMPSVLPSI